MPVILFSDPHEPESLVKRIRDIRRRDFFEWKGAYACRRISAACRRVASIASAEGILFFYYIAGDIEERGKGGKGREDPQPDATWRTRHQLRPSKETMGQFSLRGKCARRLGRQQATCSFYCGTSLKKVFHRVREGGAPECRCRPKRKRRRRTRLVVENDEEGEKGKEEQRRRRTMLYYFGILRRRYQAVMFHLHGTLCNSPRFRILKSGSVYPTVPIARR